MKQKNILVFTLGAILGTVGAILLSPTSGKDMIAQLTNRVKKQQPDTDMSNLNLYNISELSEDVEVLEKLKAEG